MRRILLNHARDQMSPEQIRGAEIDSRTDLWSLAVLFFELTAGERPFNGDTPGDVQAAILLKEFSFPADLKVPLSFRQILRRALNKDITARYQTAINFITDLKFLRSELSGTSLPETGSLSLKTAKTTAAQTIKSSQTSFFQRFLRYPLAGILLLIIGGGFWFLLNRYNQRNISTAVVSQATRITNRGKAIRATISPNGEWLAYALEEAGQQGLFLKPQNAGLNESLTLLAPSERRFSGLSFAPDSRAIYFSASNADEVFPSLYRISTDGGEPEKILENLENAPAISPNGKFIAAAYLPKDAKEYSLAIWAINQPLSQMRVVKLLEGAKLPGFIRWSVDGQTVIYIAAKKGVGNLWAQPVDGSSAHQMTHFTVNRIFSFDISLDGRSFICSRGEIAGYIVSLQLNLDKSSFPYFMIFSPMPMVLALNTAEFNLQILNGFPSQRVSGRNIFHHDLAFFCFAIIFIHIFAQFYR
ncbi:hypothetical protein BH18ACI1_BH18ACI1_24360 [soil metagenome]